MSGTFSFRKIKIYKDFKLAPLTTYKIGGNAQYYCEPCSLGGIKDALNFAKNEGCVINVIGGGSNLLISDKGVKGLVISARRLKRFSIRKNVVMAEAGVPVRDLNKAIMAHSLSGMEFSGGLPGSVGGAVYMNARAYGREMSEVVSLVCAVNREGELENFTNTKINYSYKKSVFMERDDLIIMSVMLELKKGIKKEIKELYRKNMNDRKNKGQYSYPSAGSVYKNDYRIGIPSGKIIDEAGLRGTKVGGAHVSETHGNFIFNSRNAKAEDIVRLMELVEKKVLETRGIKLEREIKLLGF